MTNNADRQIFEKWITSKGLSILTLGGEYTSAVTRDMRSAWQQASAKASGVPGGWNAKQWVSNPAAFRLTGPNGISCDIEPSDLDETHCYLRALAQYLISAAPKSASVPVERLEALQRYTGGIQVYILDSDLAELIAEYKS